MTDIIATPQKVVPPNNTDVYDALKREILKEINCSKIGVIQSFDAAHQTVTVKIAFTQVTSIAADGTQTLAAYPLLLQVPVYFPSGGGCTLTFPISAGDECLVVFNDRQIDNWFTSGAGLAPSVGRVHDLSDGIAFVGIRSLPRALGGISSAGAQLRSDDGATSIGINSAAQTVTITAPGGLVINAPFTTSTGDISSATISLEHHVHNGVQPGGGNTGMPVP